MKQHQKFTHMGQFISHSSNNSTGPTLHDSKSLSYLKNCLDEQKKFRQTTFYPTSSKNSNLGFLRYTVNINRSPAQKTGGQIFPKTKLKFHRKMTQQISSNQNNQAKEGQNSVRKFQTLNFCSPKKDKKLEKIFPGKANQQSNQSDKSLCSNDKNFSITDRHKQKLKSVKNIDSRKIYTPKTIKFAHVNKEAKIISSYSSIDLLKEDHANSPTSESVSSRIGQTKEKSERLKNFQKIKYLGEGKFGQVYLVKQKQTCGIFALKQIKKESIIKNKMEEQLIMEIKLQSFFSHPNILKLYGFFDDEENIYLILQYMEEGTLFSQLRKQKTLKQAEASRKLRDVIEGVSYLHSMNIAHRDLKPENVVISNDVCKICDLGWAAICEDRRKTLCGTIDYASPQLLQGKDYGVSIDLWCLGVLCFELMIGKAPFYHISRKQTMKKIINADLSDINIPVHIPNQTRDFITKLLKKNPEERMSAQQSLNHPLITKYKDEELEDFRVSSNKSSSS